MIPCSALPSSTVPFVAGSPVVDLRRYPIQDLESGEGAALLARVRSEYVSSGATLLPGFLTHEAMQVMATEARQSAPLRAFLLPDTMCLWMREIALCPLTLHATAACERSWGASHTTTPRGSVLAALYNWPPLYRVRAPSAWRARAPP